MEEKPDTYKRNTASLPVSIFPSRLCRTIECLKQKKRVKREEGRVGESSRSFYSELKPLLDKKSRVNGFLRERRRERKREGVGKRDSE